MNIEKIIITKIPTIIQKNNNKSNVVDKSTFDDNFQIELIINVIPNKILVFKLNDSIISNYILDDVHRLNLKLHLSNNTIQFINNYIQIKYPNSTTHEPINWSKLKDIYKNNSNDQNVIKLLTAVHSLRKITVGILKEFIIENFTQGCYNESGSNNLTSDIDFTYLNLINPKISVIMMDVFYKIIMALFKDDSADVFDTNYYICSSIIKETCYTQSQSQENKPSIILPINYGIDESKINRLNKLFNMCTGGYKKSEQQNNDYYDLNISDSSEYIKYEQTNISCKQTTACNEKDINMIFKLDKIFTKKSISKGNAYENIYLLDFPQNVPPNTTANGLRDYNNYIYMDLLMCFTLLYDCIYREITSEINKLNIADDISNISQTELIPSEKNILYERNLKYSYIYYNTLDSIKSNQNAYCDFYIKLKIIFMLKILMYLMCATANESYISDITLGIIVFKDKLNATDKFYELKCLIYFMDNFRFILEWYKLYNTQNDIVSKYKFFDSVCKYFVRISDLGNIYKETISSIIDDILLRKYNEEERANGKIIIYATNQQNIINNTITDVYTAFLSKNINQIIEPLIKLFKNESTKITSVLNKANTNDKIINKCAELYKKINEIMK